MGTSTDHVDERLCALLPESFGLAWDATKADVVNTLSSCVISASARRITVLANSMRYDLLFDYDERLMGIRHRAFESRSNPDHDEDHDISRLYEETLAAYTTLVNIYARQLGPPSFSGRYEPTDPGVYPEGAGGDWLSRWEMNSTFYQVELNSELEDGPLFVYESARKAA